MPFYERQAIDWGKCSQMCQQINNHVFAYAADFMWPKLFGQPDYSMVFMVEGVARLYIPRTLQALYFNKLEGVLS